MMRYDQSHAQDSGDHVQRLEHLQCSYEAESVDDDDSRDMDDDQFESKHYHRSDSDPVDASAATANGLTDMAMPLSQQRFGRSAEEAASDASRSSGLPASAAAQGVGAGHSRFEADDEDFVVYANPPGFSIYDSDEDEHSHAHTDANADAISPIGESSALKSQERGKTQASAEDNGTSSSAFLVSSTSQ